MNDASVFQVGDRVTCEFEGEVPDVVGVVVEVNDRAIVAKRLRLRLSMIRVGAWQLANMFDCKETAVTPSGTPIGKLDRRWCTSRNGLGRRDPETASSLGRPARCRNLG
jgi:hypothetical protein